MYKIKEHPILEIPALDEVEFLFDGKKVKGQRGLTIAAALHQAGFPVHSHSLEHRTRSLECGIGKCGACEMLVDGKIMRICVTKVDGVKEVCSVPQNYMPKYSKPKTKDSLKIYKTSVAIIGAGPSGLAVREELNKKGVANIVIDNNGKIGGQFLMQTHQFFFFEKTKKFGGMRGFDIAKTLAGASLENIMLNSTVWDILEGNRLAVKNIATQEIFFVDAEHLVIATGAVPFMPAFKNDDLPGVYTAAVVQKMMNSEFTLLGKKILTVGAGNIGYLTSYQAMQAGATVKAIIEALPREGGFPVQANRVRRLGIPIMTSHILLEALPNEDRTGIVGAIIAECKDFKVIPGTEKIIKDIDVINICTGLIPDNQLLTKGNGLFGKKCHGVGDAIRIGEGTSAVLRGKQCAFEIMQDLGVRFDYDDYLAISKEYIDSQQHPVKILEVPRTPSSERANKQGFIVMDCLYGFACNPCSFACKSGAITKSSTSNVPMVDYDKCIGCMECVSQCPGLAIFGYNIPKDWIFLPIEYAVKEGSEVFLVDDNGKKVGEGVIEKILIKPNKTNVARVKTTDLHGEKMLAARGFIVKENYPAPLELLPLEGTFDDKTYVCHCDDVDIEKLLKAIGDRKFISIDEIKHTTRLGMGACRGKRCIPRVKQLLRSYNIEVTGDATPRAPLSNQIDMGELYPKDVKETIITPSRKVVKVDSLIAGGGIAGSSLFRYMADAGMKPFLVNDERGSSWRNIAGGRPAFSLPALGDIAAHNLQLFKELQKKQNIDFKLDRYVNFAHDQETYMALEASKAWSDAYMIDKKDFQKEISPNFNPKLDIYSHALISNDCWQATPGKTVDLLRKIAIENGGTVLENAKVINVEKIGKEYHVLILNHEKEYVEYVTPLFVNALGAGAAKIARQVGIET
ncbi:MAG: FAD-dependent oxidoreductase, partial [Rikenellaceae bacterium]